MNRINNSKIIEKCLNEMYLASNPSISYTKIKKKHFDTKIKYWKKHLISLKDFKKIQKKYENILPTYALTKFYWETSYNSPLIQN